MWATSFPSPTRDSPTIREPAIRASPPVSSTRRRAADCGREGRIPCRRASYTMARMAVKQAPRRGSEPAAGARRSAEAVAGAAQLACVLEVSAEKPGNITPRHDFADTSYEDMLRSAIALGPELGRAARAGRRRDGARGGARRRAASPAANTNLGIALLLAPLARAALLGGPLRDAAGGGAGRADARRRARRVRRDPRGRGGRARRARRARRPRRAQPSACARRWRPPPAATRSPPSTRRATP